MRRTMIRLLRKSIVVASLQHVLLLLFVILCSCCIPSTAFSSPSSVDLKSRAAAWQPSRSSQQLSPSRNNSPISNALWEYESYVRKNVSRRSRSIRNVPTWLSSSSSDAAEESQSDKVPTKFVQSNPLLRDTARILRRASWFSWWSQVILTVIASVILVFAQSTTTSVIQSSMSTPSFFLSGIGVVLSTISIIWTWGNGTRLSRRFIVKPITTITAAQMLRRAIRVGVTINCIGLLCNLLAAQQIIGSLAIKVLTRGTGGWGVGGSMVGASPFLDGLQPLDILIVQANANQLLAQFCSLVSLLYLTNNVAQLDPPSTEDSPRIQSSS